MSEVIVNFAGENIESVPLPTAKGRDSFPEKMQITGNNRGWPETGSRVTAHTTIQSSQTAETVVVQKHAGSAGIFAVVGAAFRSLRMLGVSRVDFWPPVSALENSVPGDWISSGKRGPGYPGF